MDIPIQITFSPIKAICSCSQPICYNIQSASACLYREKNIMHRCVSLWTGQNWLWAAFITALLTLVCRVSGSDERQKQWDWIMTKWWSGVRRGLVFLVSLRSRFPGSKNTERHGEVGILWNPISRFWVHSTFNRWNCWTSSFSPITETRSWFHRAVTAFFPPSQLLFFQISWRRTFHPHQHHHTPAPLWASIQLSLVKL